MALEYRIKEVKVPLNSGEFIIFYPQFGYETKTTIGHLWWKKDIIEKQWDSFYRTTEGRTKGEIHSVQFDGDKIIGCTSKEEAQEVIDNYKKQCIASVKESYSKSAVNWNDDRYVKIHEVK